MDEQSQEKKEVNLVVCPASKEPGVRWIIFACFLLIGGIYCFVDHFIWGKYQYPDPFDWNAYLSYLFNHYGAILFPAAAVILIIRAVISMRRKLIADEEGIGYVGKEKIRWDAFKSLDASKLKSKGILKLKYDSNGREKVLTLDNWKLQNFRSLVELVEKKITAEK